MALPAEISREHLLEELYLARQISGMMGWEIESDPDHLIVTVRMKAYNDDLFILTGKFDDYKEIPPALDFIDPKNGEIGTAHAYPKSKVSSLFHSGGPCICAPFSRKAYKVFSKTGPHEDWKYSDWMNSTVQQVDWSNYNTLPKMVGLIHTHINRPDLYAGRMG